jgi:hypothetical protein
MGVPSGVIGELYDRLRRIQTLAKEVEDIPNFGPDLWTMREGDKKCQQIQQDAAWISAQLNAYVGTGQGDPPNWGSGPPR